MQLVQPALRRREPHLILHSSQHLPAVQHFGATSLRGKSTTSDSVASAIGPLSPKKTEMVSAKGSDGLAVAYAVKSTRQMMIVERILVKMVLKVLNFLEKFSFRMSKTVW